MAVTAVVFCAVSATSTDMPCAPAAAKAFRSAWIPAPPPESEVAIVSALGTTFTPFAGMTRIRFDGCDLSRSLAAPRYDQRTERTPVDGFVLNCSNRPSIGAVA